MDEEVSNMMMMSCLPLPARATLKGCASGAVVEVIVEARRLWFRVNGSEAFAVPGLELPARVRPWAQLCLPTAQLSILGHATPWLDPASLARPC